MIFQVLGNMVFRAMQKWLDDNYILMYWTQYEAMSIAAEGL